MPSLPGATSGSPIDDRIIGVTVDGGAGSAEPTTAATRPPVVETFQVFARSEVDAQPARATTAIRPAVPATAARDRIMRVLSSCRYNLPWPGLTSPRSSPTPSVTE